MTDDLVQRLKGHSEIMERDKGKFVRFIDVATCTEAAELIEAQAAEIARLTKWLPIETAPDDDWFLAAIEIRHKNGGNWWEYHVVWLDDETSDVHTDCEQGWSITDYSHWLALPNAPYPLSAARAAIAAAKGLIDE